VRNQVPYPEDVCN